MILKYSFSRLLNKFLLSILSVLSRLSPARGRIYMLHHISEYDEKFSISPSTLNNILRHSAGKSVTIDEMDKSKDFIVFTIDDVPEDFYIYGFPIFKKYKIPFTIFVCTELLDKKGYLTTEQLRDIASSQLCTVGSHGLNHEHYKLMNNNERLHELKESKYILEFITGKEVNYFAFPYGSFYACGFRNKKLVTQYYKAGFSTIPAYIGNFKIVPRYFLPRLNLTNKTKI